MPRRARVFAGGDPVSKRALDSSEVVLAEHARKPSLPHPDPRPPSAEEAARLVVRASALDEDWGAFVWTSMTVGARRGEMCGLQWRDVDLENSMLTIRRAAYVDDANNIQEKDTKTHQQLARLLTPSH